MDVLSPEQLRETQVDRYPLLMEQAENCHNNEHTVDIARGGDNSPNLSNDENTSGMNPPMHDNRTSSSTGVTTYQIPPASSNRINSRASILSRGEGYGHRRRSPLSSGLWISVELLVTVGQIVASIIVLCLSRDEHPKTPLFEWIMGYAAGCMATLPVLYFRYRNRNRGNELESTRSLEGSSQGSPSSEPTSYTVVSVIQTSAEENQRTMQMATRNNENQEALSTRFTGLVNHFKMGLDCFFAVWFVVGNVWIFGGHSSPSDAPKLYRLCIVFLTFSCIGYAMPFILCATICCCLPCIISILGFREDHSQARGASPESINAMPTYKFKSRKNGIVDNHEANSEAGDGGILAAGTEERALSGEDAVCCICLAKYADNEELRELPCSHVFHIECVDKWLKINASCPLCKFEVGDGGGASPAAATTHQNEQRVGYASAEGIYGGTVF